MKKYFTVLGLLLLFCCGKKSEGDSQKRIDSILKNDTVETVDTIKATTIGADLSEQGCKASAGYTWSVLKQKCLRVFEEATRLSPYDSENQTAEISAFVLFEKNGNKAELFLPDEKSSIMLERKSEGDQYVNGEWQLIPWKGYVLKKSNKIMYIGQ